MADAKRKGRPLLVYVRADWCVSCLELERSWASEPAFERATRSFVPLWVEASDDEALADISVRFGALPVPSIALIDANTGRRTLLDSRALLDHAADSVLAFLSEE